MAHDRCVEGVGRVADQLQFFPGPDTHLPLVRLARNDAGDVYLDPVRAHLYLAPNLAHDLIKAGHAHVITGDALVRDQTTRSAADPGNERVGAAGHAWALGDSRLDGVAQIDHVLEGGIRIQKTRDPGSDELLRVVGGNQRRQRIAPLMEYLGIRRRIVEGEVAVGVDEPGHHRLPTHIHDLGIRCGGVGLGAERCNAVAANKHRGFDRLCTGPVDD